MLNDALPKNITAIGLVNIIAECNEMALELLVAEPEKKDAIARRLVHQTENVLKQFNSKPSSVINRPPAFIQEQAS